MPIKILTSYRGNMNEPIGFINQRTLKTYNIPPAWLTLCVWASCLLPFFRVLEIKLVNLQCRTSPKESLMSGYTFAVSLPLLHCCQDMLPGLPALLKEEWRAQFPLLLIQMSDATAFIDISYLIIFTSSYRHVSPA